MSNADSGNANLPASPWIDGIDLRMLNQDAARRDQEVEPALIGLVSPFLEIPFEGLAEGLSDRPVEPNSLAECEFRLDRLPPKARSLFGHGHGAWQAAVTEAATAGIREPNELADLAFFMHHPERVAAGVGRLIARTDPDSFKLRAEWNRHRKNVIGILRSLACTVFLAPNPSKSYEDYVAPVTTGRVTLMINGRDSGGKGPHTDHTEAFDNMQAAVESLGSGDSILLAAWMFDPSVPLTTTSPAGVKTWGELLQERAKHGIKIRIIMTEFSRIAWQLRNRVYEEFLPSLNKLIDELTGSTRDNLKYIVSGHPATVGPARAGVHHQKFMIVKKAEVIFAFCGGLDIAYMRTPFYWTPPNYPWYWHDIHAKLEGLIARDLEHEFILRWNREKGALAVARSKHTGANAFENLAQAAPSADDKKADIDTQKVQMLRTVSVHGIDPDVQNIRQNIRRDDIWQGYLNLIGCASRFLFMENQYFREPRLADAIVKQARARPKLMVIVVVPEQLDDPENAIKLHGNWLQNSFFTRLFAGLGPTRLRVYTMFHRIIHSKLIFADDRLLFMGSANANPRGFFLDTELNIMVDDVHTVKEFRHRLWAHELGIPQSTVAGWDVPNFFTKWDAAAKANARLKMVPDEMTGEGVTPFDPRNLKAKKQTFADVLT